MPKQRRHTRTKSDSLAFVPEPPTSQQRKPFTDAASVSTLFRQDLRQIGKTDTNSFRRNYTGGRMDQKTRLKMAQEVIEQQTEIIEERENQLADAVDGGMALLKRVEELEEELNQKSQSFRELETKYDEASSEHNSFEQRYKKVRSERNEFKSENLRLQEENLDLQKQIQESQDLEQRNNDLNARVQDLYHKLEAYRDAAAASPDPSTPSTPPRTRRHSFVNDRERIEADQAMETMQQNEIEELSRYSSQLEKETENLKSTVERLRRENTFLAEEPAKREKAEAVLEEMRQENEALRRKITDSAGRLQRTQLQLGDIMKNTEDSTFMSPRVAMMSPRYADNARRLARQGSIMDEIEHAAEEHVERRVRRDMEYLPTVEELHSRLKTLDDDIGIQHEEEEDDDDEDDEEEEYSDDNNDDDEYNNNNNNNDHQHSMNHDNTDDMNHTRCGDNEDLNNNNNQNNNDQNNSIDMSQAQQQEEDAADETAVMEDAEVQRYQQIVEPTLTEITDVTDTANAMLRSIHASNGGEEHSRILVALVRILLDAASLRRHVVDQAHTAAVQSAIERILSRRRDALRTALTEQRTETASLRQEVEQRTKEQETAETTAERLQDNVRRLESELQDRQDRIDELEKELEQLRNMDSDHRHEQQQEMDTLQHKIAALEQEREQQEKEKDELQSMLSQAQEETAQQEQAAVSLKEAWASKEDDYRQSVTKAERLQDQVVELNHELQDRQDRIDELEKELEQLRNMDSDHRHEQQQEMDTLQHKIAALEQERETETKQLREERDHAWQEHAAVMSKLQQCQTRYQEMDAEREERERMLTEMREQVTEMETMQEKEQRMKAEERREKERLQEEVQRLEAELSTEAAEHAEREKDRDAEVERLRGEMASTADREREEQIQMDLVSHGWSMAEVSVIAAYVSRRLPDPWSAPVLENQGLGLFRVCADGVALCRLINACVPGTIDERVINTDIADNSRQDIIENLTLAIESARGLGCHLPTDEITAETLYADASVHGAWRLLDVVWQVIRTGLLRTIHVAHLSDLVALLHSGEDITVLTRMRPEQILLRWVNHHLHQQGQRPIDNLSEDIKDGTAYIHLLAQLRDMDSSSTSATDPLEYLPLPEDQRVARILSSMRDDLGCIDFTQSTEAIRQPSARINLALVASLLHTRLGLQPESAAVREMPAFEFSSDGSREERAFRAWIQSLGLECNNLFEDMKDGVLLASVVDRIQEGAINWKKIRRNPSNQFQQTDNCNHAVDTIQSEFGIKLVNISGRNIQDGNETFVLAVIWQLMRYNITRLLRSLSSDGSMIQDDDILRWANDKISAAQRPSSLSSFRDPSLKNAVPLIDLCYALSPRAVNLDLMHTGSSPEQCEENAKYAISVARKLGATLFLLWEDIVEVKQKMILTFVGSLMAAERRRESL